jgi:hypothetical protein
MRAWLRSLADKITGRTGKPSRLDTATRMAMDADFTEPAREARCRMTPSADDPDQLAELLRILDEGDKRT